MNKERNVYEVDSWFFLRGILVVMRDTVIVFNVVFDQS